MPDIEDQNARIPTSAAPDSELLWDYMLRQQEFSISQFSTSLIGLGALLFAYGEILPSNEYTRVAIGVVGLGASFVLWAHTFGARQDAKAARAEMEAEREHLGSAFVRIMSWRRTTFWGRIYPSVTRSVIYFNGMMAYVWVTIIVHTVSATDSSKPGLVHLAKWVLPVADACALVVAAILWVYLSDKMDEKRSLRAAAVLPKQKPSR